jgi:hypothetical protein
MDFAPLSCRWCRGPQVIPGWVSCGSASHHIIVHLVHIKTKLTSPDLSIDREIEARMAACS